MDKYTLLKSTNEYLQDEFAGRSERKFRPGIDAVPVSGAVIYPEDLLAVVDTVLDGWITEKNDANKFINRVSSYCDVPYGVLCNSGSSADLLAVAGAKELYGRTRGKVVTCATGFPTTVGAIINNGLTPLLVDVDWKTLNPNEDDLIHAAKQKDVIGIIQAHTLGFPFDARHVRDHIRNDQFLIEDICDALGAEINNYKVGQFGDASTLSFFPAHHITTGEGGAVITRNKDMEVLLDSYRSWGKDCYCLPGFDNTCGHRFDHPEFDLLPAGWDHKYTFSRPGHNLKMTEMQASLGLSQMNHLGDFIRTRINNHGKLYVELLFYRDWLRFYHSVRGGLRASPFGFPITVTTDAFTKQELVAYLEDHKIKTRPIFAGNIVRQPMMKSIDYDVYDNLEYSDYVMERSFWIGCHPQITDAHIDYVSDTFKSFFREKGLI